MITISLDTFPVSVVLPLLLEDRTTGRNILLAAEGYMAGGEAVPPETELTPELLERIGPDAIKPRCAKKRTEQEERTRRNAEVFTPVWVCNKMNNFCDAEWFGRQDVFNIENGQDWEPVTEKIAFPKGKDWRDYIASPRLEITCGEAPFLVSRYDPATGEEISDLSRRIGILDRKLRVAGEHTQKRGDWIKEAIRAFQSVYGYELQGDNLLLARINLLLSFTEYLEAHGHRQATEAELREIAEIIAWNLWQMDGLTNCVPFAEPPAPAVQGTLFGDPETGIPDLPVICRIFDWREGIPFRFRDIGKGWSA